MDSEFYKINPATTFFKKIPVSILLFCIFLAVSCNQKVVTGIKNGNATHCTDSAIAYRQTIIPGIQKTDLDGNIIETKSVQYRLYLFSARQNVVIDSVKIGNAGVTFSAKPVTEKPLYRDPKNEIILVDSTDCFVQEIVATENIQGPAGEDKAQDILLYYSKDKTASQITIKRSIVLSQAVVE